MTKREALEGAVEMLHGIMQGKSYNAVEYMDLLHGFEAALNDPRTEEDIQSLTHNQQRNERWTPEVDPLDQGDNLGESPDY